MATTLNFRGVVYATGHVGKNVSVLYARSHFNHRNLLTVFFSLIMMYCIQIFFYQC